MEEWFSSLQSRPPRIAYNTGKALQIKEAIIWKAIELCLDYDMNN